MNNYETNLVPNSSKKFYCEKCVYLTSRKSQWERHILTRKHKSETFETNMKQNSSEVFQQINCFCGKTFNSRSTIWRHKKICNVPQETKNEINLSKNDIIQMFIKENSEFKNMVLDVVKLVQPINNNTNNNNNNNTFNLQFYLNDICKDAVNLVDFVDSLQVKINDLEETAHLGYSEGVSRIFINGLNELEVSKRPIHCSDAKRETIYIKDQGAWEKDDTNKSHLIKAIKVVSQKNADQIFEWQKKYPEYNDPDSRQSDRYMEMISNTICGSKEERDKNLVKIVKNVTKEIIIDKNIE